jgi:hypothetical protein
MVSESIALRFDFDIFSIRPRSTAAPVERSISAPPGPASISSGATQRPSAER